MLVTGRQTPLYQPFLSPHCVVAMSGHVWLSLTAIPDLLLEEVHA